MEKRIDLSYAELTRLWDQWINDSSLRQQLRFGQYVLNRFPVSWPECYYAGSERAYSLLYEQTEGWNKPDGMETIKQDSASSSRGG